MIATKKKKQFIITALLVLMVVFAFAIPQGAFAAKDEINIAANKTTKQMRCDAADWAASIANDNSFNYGKGKRAHRYGCYFCGTNVTGLKKAKSGSKWEKTYCSNPFIEAAYAHGAGDSEMLKCCKNCTGPGLAVQSWTGFGFENKGKIKKSKLVKGDVLLKKGIHVAIYVGNGKIAEAAHEGWDKNSIHVVKLSKARYKEGFTNVLRYYKPAKK